MKTKVEGTKRQPHYKIKLLGMMNSNFYLLFSPRYYIRNLQISWVCLPWKCWLIIYCVHEIFTYMELSPLDLCSASNAFEQGGIFIVPHLLWHGASVFSVSSKGSSHSIASYDTQGDTEDLFLPWSLFQSSITIPKGMLITDLIWGPIFLPGSTRIWKCCLSSFTCT